MKIEIKNWSTKDRTATLFSEVARDTLAPRLMDLGYDTLIISDHAGGYVKPTEEAGDRSFRVHIYATPIKGNEEMSIPNEMWNVRVRSCRGGIFPPSGTGLVIVDPQSEFAAAELVGGDLYVLFKCNPDCCIDVPIEVFRKILVEATPLLGKTLPGFDRVAAGDCDVPDRFRGRNFKAEIASGRQTLTQEIARATAAYARVFAGNGYEDEAGVIFEMIRGIPEVKRIETVGEGTLRICTHTLYGVAGDSIREFGEFTIDLTFGPYAGKPSFRNLTRRVEYGGDLYGHPHVQRGSYYCMGEGEQIMSLVQEYEFVAAVIFALKAVQTVNTNSSGNYLQVAALFPEVGKVPPYPEEDAVSDPDAYGAFLKLYVTQRDAQAAAFEKELEALIRSVRETQAAVARLIFLERITSAPPANIALAAASAVEKVLSVPGVSGVKIDGRAVRVEVKDFASLDRRSGARYPVGDLTISCWPDTGSVTLSAPRGVRSSAAPHVNFRWGDGLPVGQLSASVPELLSRLEIAQAVTIILRFLQEFDGGTVPAKDLEKWEEFAVR